MLGRHELRNLDVLLGSATVKRMGSDPTIHMYASLEQIGVNIDLKDFVRSAALDARARHWWLRWLPVDKALLAGAVNVVEAMKAQTPKILAR